MCDATKTKRNEMKKKINKMAKREWETRTSLMMIFSLLYARTAAHWQNVWFSVSSSLDVIGMVVRLTSACARAHLSDTFCCDFSRFILIQISRSSERVLSDDFSLHCFNTSSTISKYIFFLVFSFMVILCVANGVSCVWGGNDRSNQIKWKMHRNDGKMKKIERKFDVMNDGRCQKTNYCLSQQHQSRRIAIFDNRNCDVLKSFFFAEWSFFCCCSLKFLVNISRWVRRQMNSDQLFHHWKCIQTHSTESKFLQNVAIVVSLSPAAINGCHNLTTFYRRDTANTTAQCKLQCQTHVLRITKINLICIQIFFFT